MQKPSLKKGDFTSLAESYSKYRPGYSTTVRDSLLGTLGVEARKVEVADVGAGTGIWSRMLAEKVKRVLAIEPNEEMRRHGIEDSTGHRIEYRAGSGEATGLPAASVDMVTMASSFHWVDFDKGLAEFHRILRPGGRFAALWNPRLIEANPMLVEIEAQISRLAPEIKRVSSGASGITETLTERLWASRKFDDVTYIEGRHVAEQTPEQYLGVWRSVIDVQVQLGPERWQAFLSFVEQRVSGLSKIVTTYRTRAWCARSVK